jgi:eukaryotic-like serine/threonine-protein kinase
MNTWNPKANEIFLQALELPTPGEREEYLDRVCQGDAALKAEVEALLAAGAKAGSFLESPAMAPQLAVTVERPLVERPGTIIGPYKLLEQIGEGGFGVVFMAEQQQPLRRKVAIKVLKPGMDTRQVVARFEAERQALALMDHPNIAKVLDAGATDSGRPYFVMELVKGIPITDYCDQNQLTPRERLELFAYVCQAIQHAHQKGIIHRDIKPSNVLVTLHDGEPLVKVIDFGVAKALGQQLTDKTLFTGFAQLIGTPLYMSPEQAALSNVDVDTRSDIYSLGVLLYELLTGTTPFDNERLKRAGYDEMCRIIREEEPPKPSTRISTLGRVASTVSTHRKSDPKRLSQLIRGELDWIVMKCLEKDRGRRYETANGLAMDVQRYLRDEPVLACPPSAGYRLRKFARRNGRMVATVAVVAIALVAGTVISTWQALRATHAETLAEKRLNAEIQARADAVANLGKAREAGEEFFTVVSESKLLEEPGLQPLRKDLLEAAVRYYEGLAALGEPNDPESLADLAATQLRMVQIYHPGFEDLHISALEKALTLMEKLLNECPDNAALHARLAGFWHGGRQLAGVAQPVDLERAIRAYEHAIAVWERLVERYPQVIGFQSDLSKFHDMVADRQIEAGRRDDAFRSWQKVREIREGIVKSDPRVYEHIAELSYTYRRVAESLEGTDAKEAEALYRRAIEIQNDVPDVPNYQEFLANAHRDFAKFLGRQKRPEEALPHHREACRIFEKLVARYPHVSSYRQMLDDWKWEFNTSEFQSSADQTLKNADALKARGSLEEAVAEYSKAIELDPKSFAAWTSRGEAYRELQQYDKALADFSKAIELEPSNAWVWHERGWTYRETQQYDKALADLNKAIELDPKDLAAWVNRGAAHRALKQYDKALADLTKAIEVEPNHAWPWHERGWAYRESRQYDKAFADLNKAIELNPKDLGAWINRGLAYKELGQYKESLADLTRAVELEPNNGWAWHVRACTYRETQQYDKALADLNKAIELEPNNAWVWHDRACTYRETQQYDKALADWSKAIQLKPDEATFRDRAFSYKELGEHDKAVADLTRAIELDPKRASAWTRRGEAFIDLALLPEAAADVARAFQLEAEPSGYSMTFVRHAILRRCVNDDPGYRQACHRMLARFADSTILDPLAFVISPEPGVDPPRAVALAERFVAQSKTAWFVAHLGLALFRTGEFERAVAALEESLALDANFNPPYVHSALAMALHKIGNTERARAALDKARAARHEQLEAALTHDVGFRPHDWWMWSLIYAEFVYKEAYALLHGSPPPDDPRWLILRGRGLEAIGRVDEARAAFAEAFALAPDDLMIRIRALPPISHADAYAQALAGLRVFLKEHPQQSSAARLALAQRELHLGGTEEHAGQIQAAAEAFGEAAAGYEAVIAGLAANADSATADVPAAAKDIAWYRHELGYVLVWHGSLLSQLGQLPEAEAALKRGLEVHESLTDDPEAPADAKARLEWNKVKLAQLYRDRATHLASEAAAEQSRGKFPEAIAAYAKAIELAPNNTVVHNNLAWLYATCPETELRDPARAVTLAKKAVELKPEEGTSWNTLGAAQYREGDFKAAVEALTKSLELRGGGDAFDWYFLAMAHCRLGQVDDARKWHQQAIEWEEKNGPLLAGNREVADELRRFRAEAEELLETK